MRQFPNITTVESVIKGAKVNSCGLSDGRWVPARPLGFLSWQSRWKAAWLVFTGRADALKWDGQ